MKCPRCGHTFETLGVQGSVKCPACGRILSGASGGSSRAESRAPRRSMRSGSMSVSNRRRSTRSPAKGSIQFGNSHGELIDVSVYGCKARFARNLFFVPDTYVDLKLPLPGREKPVELLARVVRVEEDGHVVAFEFERAAR